MSAILQSHLTSAAETAQRVCRLLNERDFGKSTMILRSLREVERAIESYPGSRPRKCATSAIA
jgi:hypothetical protein